MFGVVCIVTFNHCDTSAMFLLLVILSYSIYSYSYYCHVAIYIRTTSSIARFSLCFRCINTTQFSLSSLSVVIMIHLVFLLRLLTVRLICTISGGHCTVIG